MMVFISLRHRLYTGSRVHPSSYSMSTRGSYHGVMRLGREADHPHPSSAEIKNACSYTSTPPTLLRGAVLN